MKIMPDDMAAARAWLALSPPMPDVLHWHRKECPGCYREDGDGPPVRCAEWTEIITEYSLPALAGS